MLSTKAKKTEISGSKSGARPGGFSPMGLVVSALLFLCAAWGLFALNTAGIASSASVTSLPVPREGISPPREKPFSSPPITVPDEAFARPRPISPPPPPPAEEEKTTPAAVAPAPAKPAPVAAVPAPAPAPASVTINPKNPPREIIERVPEAKPTSGEQWYSVRAGYSDSRARSDTLRQVLVARGFTKAVTERDTDGLYYVRVEDFRFRHLAEDTVKELEGMGLEPTLHERTVAK